MESFSRLPELHITISVGISGLGFKIPGSGFPGIPTLQSRDFPGSTQ